MPDVPNQPVERCVEHIVQCCRQFDHTQACPQMTAGLGNGGLGRLAACFMDSIATMQIPAYGYGIRYEHGLFRQRFENGWQIEEPEDWLTQDHVWEFERPEAAFEVGFGGNVYENGGRTVWRPHEAVIAQAFDTPVIGWKGRSANTLRLWGALPKQVLDLGRFNAGVAL